MARPLRLEFPGALWHVTARGNRQQDIFRDDQDRKLLLDLLGACIERCEWIVPAYVLMTNHFHLVIQLRSQTLSKGMQWLNGTYAQAFNRRHRAVGHLFQGRFHARLIEKDAYFAQVLRYVVLNPVRAGLVNRADEYAWSSHRAVIGGTAAPKWLAIDDVLAQFDTNRQRAIARYRHFVHDAVGIVDAPWREIVGQIYLGTDDWLKSVRGRVDLAPRSNDHPGAQRLIGVPSMAEVIAAVAKEFQITDERVRAGRGTLPRMVAAWVGWSRARLLNRHIAVGLRLRSSGYVSKLIRRCEQEFDRDPLLRDRVDRCLSTLSSEKCEGKL